ncbi:MAG TPA: peptidoglycan-binding domain-containing protein [Solirubrobacteraceae bacterium]|nr:peptidoglycan-binding domain-containing protein [Solirubrobacteraceae bacterium]
MIVDSANASSPAHPAERISQPITSRSVQPVSYAAASPGYQQGAWVVNVQRDLAQLGYYTGGFDGVYGPETTAAVEAFQSANGLTADGIAGPLTMAKIAQDLAGNGSQPSSTAASAGGSGSTTSGGSSPAGSGSTTTPSGGTSESGGTSTLG